MIRNIISRGNPAYFEDGGWCNCADGIYIDGGTGIRVERNRVVGNDIGIEVAAENARGRADHVVVADNFITRSGYVGIATGGYCDGADDCGGVDTGRRSTTGSCTTPSTRTTSSSTGPRRSWCSTTRPAH